MLEEKFTDQKVGKITIIDNFGKLHISNPEGVANMNQFALKFAESVKDIDIPFTLIMQGKPYAFFNFNYHICTTNEYGFSFVLTMYPAGFRLRFDMMMIDFNDFVSDMIEWISKQYNKHKNGMPIVLSEIHKNESDDDFYWYNECSKCDSPIYNDGKCPNCK